MVNPERQLLKNNELIIGSVGINLGPQMDDMVGLFRIKMCPSIEDGIMIINALGQTTNDGNNGDEDGGDSDISDGTKLPGIDRMPN
jgi:hypothetical protein